MTKAGVPGAWASVLVESVSTKQPKLLVERRRCSLQSKRRLLRCTCWLSSGPTLQTSRLPEMLRHTSALHCQSPCLARTHLFGVLRIQMQDMCNSIANLKTSAFHVLSSIFVTAHMSLRSFCMYLVAYTKLPHQKHCVINMTNCILLS